MRPIQFFLAPLASVAFGCAARHTPTAPIAGEVRGIYLQGMEGSLLRRCNDSTSFGQTIAFQTGVERPTPWPEGGRSTWRGWTHRAYYAHLVVRDVARATPPGSAVLISSRPQLAITKVIE